MIRSFLFLMTVLVLASTARADTPDLIAPVPDASDAAWSMFSDNLVEALQSDNHGLQCSALQHIVTYRDRVDVRAARFDIVRLYRDHSDMRVRLLALSALAEMKDAWVTDFLNRSALFEKDEHLARLTAYAASASNR